MDSKKCNFDFGGYRHTKENALLIKQRREKILEMHESGLSFDDISKFFGISKSRCRKIHSIASQRPKALKVASVVRGVLRSYLPMLILKDGSFIKINYPLLFVLLESKSDYFKAASSKAYIRLIVHSSRADLMLFYNKLLSKFGCKTPAQKWIRSDNAVVPPCFWNNKEIESFLLNCSLIRKAPPDTAKAMIDRVQEIIGVSPSFDIPHVDITDTTQEEQKEPLPLALVKEVEELVDYVNIVKGDGSLSREDYIVVLDSALSCLNKFKDFFKQPIEVAENVETNDFVDKVKEPVKAKPKAFWPKPKF